MANQTIADLTEVISVNDNDKFIIYKTSEGTKSIKDSNLKPYLQQSLVNNFINNSNTLNPDNLTNIYLYGQDDDLETLSIKKISKDNFIESIFNTDVLENEITNYLTNNPISIEVNPSVYLGKGTPIPVETITEASTINLNDYISKDELGRYYYDYNQYITLENKPAGLNSTTNFNMIVEQLTDSIIRQTIRPYNSTIYYARDILREYWIQIIFEEGESFDQEITYYEENDSEYTETQDQTPDPSKTYYIKGNEEDDNVISNDIIESWQQIAPSISII